MLENESQVLVEVKASGLIFADIYTRQGLIREICPPFVMGLECSGTIIKKGSDVTLLKVGFLSFYWVFSISNNKHS